MSNVITNELLLEEIRRNRQEIKSAVEAVETRILLKIEEQKQRINDIEIKCAQLADKVENIERKGKENNIVIFGLQKKPEEISIEFISTEIKELFDVEVCDSDLNNFYTLGKKENCPLKLEFVSYRKKASIISNAKKLKGTNISVVNDMTVKQREEHKTLRKHLFRAKQNKDNNCYIRKNRLHINSVVYTAQQLQALDDINDEECQWKHTTAPHTPTNYNIKI